VDANVLIAVITCGAGVLVTGISTGMILWKGGAQAERVETSVRRIEGIETKLEVLAQIPVIQTRIGTLEEVITRMRSDHRELAAQVRETTETAIRAEMASQHDLGD
jgi:hypothetical protein